LLEKKTKKIFGKPLLNKKRFKFQVYREKLFSLEKLSLIAKKFVELKEKNERK